MDLRGRNVLVTGASRGIGEAIAKRFVAEGAHVIGVARNAELLGKVMADIGGTAVPTDLADTAQVDGLIERIERDHGPVDILVNNAGLDMAGALVDTSAEDVRTIHQVNLVTPIELCRQVLPGMLRRGRGHLVNVSSLAGVAAFSGMTSYASTKAGLSQSWSLAATHGWYDFLLTRSADHDWRVRLAGRLDNGALQALDEPQ